LEGLGVPAPFNSSVMSATSLMPLPCVRYKADQAHARQAAQAADLAERASAHKVRANEIVEKGSLVSPARRSLCLSVHARKLVILNCITKQY
jgi:hypothetical protein